MRPGHSLRAWFLLACEARASAPVAASAPPPRPAGGEGRASRQTSAARCTLADDQRSRVRLSPSLRRARRDRWPGRCGRILPASPLTRLRIDSAGVEGRAKSPEDRRLANVGSRNRSAVALQPLNSARQSKRTCATRPTLNKSERTLRRRSTAALLCRTGCVTVRSLPHEGPAAAAAP